MQNIIFIFSLPRSGSTLLQKILMAHTLIESTDEPWIILPLVYMTKKTGVLSEYNHKTSYTAIQDLIRKLPDNYKTINSLTANFIKKIYKNLIINSETEYFLDKTPRYYLIIDQIIELFPNAKFIFLFRNPIQIYSSYLRTWNNNRFINMHRSYYDLYRGPNILAKKYKKYKNESYHVNYEKFVQNPEIEIRKILDYLELEYQKDIIKIKINSKKILTGNMGDKTGKQDYNDISTDSLNKWKGVFNNCIRKQIAKRYILQTDDVFFETAKYQKSEILFEISKLKCSSNKILKDLFDIIYSKISLYLRPEYYIDKRYRWMKDKPLL